MKWEQSPIYEPHIYDIIKEYVNPVLQGAMIAVEQANEDIRRYFEVVYVYRDDEEEGWNVHITPEANGKELQVIMYYMQEQFPDQVHPDVGLIDDNVMEILVTDEPVW